MRFMFGQTSLALVVISVSIRRHSSLQVYVKINGHTHKHTHTGPRDSSVRRLMNTSPNFEFRRSWRRQTPACNTSALDRRSKYSARSASEHRSLQHHSHASSSLRRRRISYAITDSVRPTPADAYLSYVRPTDESRIRR